MQLKIEKMKKEIYKGLLYSTKEINYNFLIRIRINGISRLVGVAGLIEGIGVEFANKFLDRAFGSLEDKCICKLRRGLQVEFVSH